MATAGLDMSRQTLQNTTMHVQRIRGKSTVEFSRIYVEIYSFGKLNRDTTYSTVIGRDKWDLQVVKARKNATLKLCVTKANLASVDCYVMYDDALRSSMVTSERRSWNTHVITLPKDIINNPANAFLTSGRGLVCVLEVRFLPPIADVTGKLRGLSDNEDDGISPPTEPEYQFYTGTERRGKEQLPYLSFPDRNNRVKYEVSDKEYLRESLMMQTRHPFTDFEIRTAEGLTVPAHRSVLAARAGFFRDELRKNEDMKSVDSRFFEGEVQAAMSYTYYAQILCLNPVVIPQLSELSIEYRMESLDKFCQKFMNNYLDAKR